MKEEEAINKIKDKMWRLNHLYKIQTKDAKLVTFKMNRVQKMYFTMMDRRNIILKARQMGMTTFCSINMLDDTLTNPNTTSALIAHTRDDAMKIFEIIKRAYRNMPDMLRPTALYDNRNELYFPDLDSKIYVDTDLRGGTTHNVHISEVAFIEKAEGKMAGILESVPPHGRITLESTANGVGGYFFDQWEDPKSEFKKHFFNWLWDEGYQEDLTLDDIDSLLLEYEDLSMRYGLIPDAYSQFMLTEEQFLFYTKKIRRLKNLVLQEYPLTALEAFISSGRNVFFYGDLQKHTPQPFIDRRFGDVKIWEKPLENTRYVIGCDVAEGLGGDYSVIEVFNADTGEQAAEYVSNAIAPDDLADYLKDLGTLYNKAFICIEVNNHGRSTIDNLKKRYYNLYRRQTFDNITNKTTSAIGWRTTGTSKPLLVDNLEEAVREKNIHIRSERVLKEMRNFVQTEEPGHQGFGALTGHDDSVIACGLVIQAMKNLPAAKRPLSTFQKKYLDYKKTYKASLESPYQEVHKRNRPRQGIRSKYGIKTS